MAVGPVCTTTTRRTMPPDDCWSTTTRAIKPPDGWGPSVHSHRHNDEATSDWGPNVHNAEATRRPGSLWCVRRSGESNPQANQWASQPDVVWICTDSLQNTVQDRDPRLPYTRFSTPPSPPPPPPFKIGIFVLDQFGEIRTLSKITRHSQCRCWLMADDRGDAGWPLWKM